MAKEQDQTQETTEEIVVDSTEKKDVDTSIDKAVKTSKDFDKLIDTEGVEETPPAKAPAKDVKAKAVKSKAKEPETKTDAKTDDESTGEEEETVEEKTDDEIKTEDGSHISPELAKRAIDLGLTEEEIVQFENDAELEKTVKIIEDVVGEDDEPKPSSQAPAPPDKPKGNDGDDSIVKFKDESEIDPEILANIKAVEKKYKDEVKALRDEVADMKAGVQKQQQDRFVQRFDGMIDKLGLEFADVFGKGSLNDLSKRSQAFRNRDAVRGRMYAFAKGLSDSNQAIPDEQALFDLAVNSLHGKKVQAVKGLRTKSKTDARAKQRIGRAAAGKSKSLSGDEAAIQTSKDFDAMIDSSED
ncbi:MAG: hypothetical protein MUO78_02735 [candidate division Zixibacteria bacterium]|nr:hypothetical protein [candidate division Zixibacteria bacterium]